ncbi:hypothetical protein DSM03_101444 [Leeuwenhoekiella aestuarii]|uniref:Uncharacterized protein n=1 Tax=Leeuwenhoekiella aestuarii TaxID=2249426 RepID=A0A4Q0NTW4_9FLAO|nr:hypothetical protein [Leeuwenhoekiella aestuarii]RXG14326.1 hypothetical protein DSM04_104435 [Leeuwenhoekiella aestuarii]RXG19075.1 hypothetical protein DSM03_101444 [Leeuwenhoekiella aestuarii]
MNVDELKNIWKNDMNSLEKRVQINEEKLKNVEFNKAQSSFDKFLKISIAGKNMALVYAALSVVMMVVLRESPLYLGLLFVASALMVFSYFQHSTLKKIDYGKLSILDLQKAISKFRIHTAKTAIYDISIVAIWVVFTGLSFVKWKKGWDVFENSDQLLENGILFGVLLLLLVLGSKYIYADYDKKLKENENDLERLNAYGND